jgi:NADH-quinone oxidoreductase subunit G
MLNLTIDDRKISVEEGTTVIQAAEEAGIYIPRYCYHPGLSIAGNCRICLVDVENSPKLQIACNLPVTDGMVVHTQNDKAESGRKSVLEFLLANHPLDCPVCDQSGECDLQNFYMDFGIYNPRFQEHKVKKRKALQLGPHVMLDQERCILCSRCVRFTDEITNTGEFGIFNRGDSAELGLVPGETLDNPYSANVVDICPVGALTEKDFRFKSRVWYLSGASTVCNGCSQGCNIDLHFLLNRPHLNAGSRIVRVKPRLNQDVNQWWMCDEGRYGFDWVDKDRLEIVRGPSGDANWDQALTEIAAMLAGSEQEGLTNPGATETKIGVIASAQLTNEELFLIQKIFKGAQISTSVPEDPGTGDDFLIKTDKNPNTQGAIFLGLAGPSAPKAEQLVEAAINGSLDILWVFGHNMVALFGEEKVRLLSERLSLFIFSGTNNNPTAELAHWTLPSAAYVEKDGTFVNCHGRVQRIGRAFPPIGDSREDWRFLLELATKIGLSFGWSRPEEVFQELAATLAPFRGMTYEKIGDQGSGVAFMDPQVISS